MWLLVIRFTVNEVMIKKNFLMKFSLISSLEFLIKKNSHVAYSMLSDVNKFNQDFA